MAITFEELSSELASGFTKSHNQLDDLLLAELPAEYYCVYRFLWRRIFGWANKHKPPKLIAVSLSLRAIAKGSGVNVGVVSRAVWFFHYIQFIRYMPGRRGTNSQFELFPIGMLNLGDLSKMIACLHKTLAYEKQVRGHNKNFHYPNANFCQVLSELWIKDFGGAVAGACSIPCDPDAVALPVPADNSQPAYEPY